MTYTDEDILSLYEDLSTIGAAETPEEEVYRLVKAWSNDSLKDPSLIQSVSIIHFLLAKSVPHTYLVSVYFLTSGCRYPRLMVVPVVRGMYILDLSKFGPVEDLKEHLSGYPLRPTEHFTCESPLSLHQKIQEIRRSRTVEFGEKYDSLLEDLISRDPAASESDLP
jgi:hypothetical protein